MVMDFEWDARKAAQNVAKHGVPFDYAARVFLDPRRLDTEDMRFTYREQRWVTLGKISGRLFAVAYTLRGGVVRLIRPGRLMHVSRGDTMKRYRLDPKKPRQLTRAEASRLKAARLDYSDIPPLDKAFLTRASASWPPVKKQLTIRIDEDVLKWLRAHGRGYQTRINRILRVVMESQPR